MGKLEQLLKKAVKVKTQIDQLEKTPKLTAESFVRDAMKVARTTNEKLDKIEIILSEQPEVYQSVNALLRRCQAFIREATCPCATSDIRRLRWLSNPDCDPELSAMKSNLFEAFALAARRVAKQYPEAFGEVIDWAKFTKNFADLEDFHKKLCSEIETSYGPEDLLLDEPDGSGRVRASFKLSNGEVSLGVEAGRRLTEWYIANPVKV